MMPFAEPFTQGVTPACDVFWPSHDERFPHAVPKTDDHRHRERA